MHLLAILLFVSGSAVCHVVADGAKQEFVTADEAVHSQNETTTAELAVRTAGIKFDCRLAGQECLHDGLCSADGTHCNCFQSPNWFGRQCELRRCAQRFNPCMNAGECEKTPESFRCHCPTGFAGIYCEQHVPNICDQNVGNKHNQIGGSGGNAGPCGEHGICQLGATLDQYTCKCHYGWTGANCTGTDFCLGHVHECVNGECMNDADGHHCVCRAGWGGQRCDVDVDECKAAATPSDNGQSTKAEICQNGGKCVNLIGSFYCDCANGFVGQFCDQPNAVDECKPSTCLNGGQCKQAILATTAEWALDIKQFDWHWECECPRGFEGARCEQTVDDCTLGNLICVNGGQCVRPWVEEQFDALPGVMVHRQWHPAQCKCTSGFSGDFCEMDINECEMYTGVCQNGATCMNRHGTYMCLCVGGFEGRHCELNIDDCVDNLCYAGSTCVDGISRYNCMCAPDRIGNLCEFPNPCRDNPCANGGQCFADFETGNYTCRCEDGWTGRNCTEDVDECAHPDTNRCFNGKCVNTLGGFHCECDSGYTDEYCSTLIRYCDANPCQNGGTCLNDLGRYDCVCLAGYSGKHCEIRAYQELNKCYLECQNGGICQNASAQQCDCPSPYAGILCEIDKPDPCEQNQCALGSICAPNMDYISYTCHCPQYLAGQFCERRLAPCQDTYNPCVHGECHPTNVSEHEEYRCECIAGWGGQLCDTPLEQTDPHDDLLNAWHRAKCAFAENPCRNGGQCVVRRNDGGVDSSSALPASSDSFECICPHPFSGPLCEIATGTIKTPAEPERRCGHCRNGGKCTKNGEGFWACQCPSGFDGAECENERNPCLNVTCLHKGKCINLAGVDYRCDCAPGWEGVHCEVNVDECENIICLNGGVCKDRVNNYRCQCARGFAGRHCEISIPVDKFNQTDLVDLNNCKRANCDQKARNGRCDPECNLFACQFDGGDCSTKQPNPFEKCPQPSYCAHVFADGKCDEICNNERCLFDGFDCVPRPLEKCPRMSECAQRYANAQCDQQCNMAACGWDGGDCDHEAESDPSEQPQILSGELMLVLALRDPARLFPTMLRQFLLKLSAHLRASLALASDENAKPKLFKWRSDTGIGERIEIPTEFNGTSMFRVHYGERADTTNAQIQRKRRSMETAALEGVAMFLRVDVTMCNLLHSNWAAHSNDGGIPEAAIHSVTEQLQQSHGIINSLCFSDLNSAAAYVGMASAKEALQDIGVPILHSEARLAPPPPPPSNRLFARLWHFVLGLSLLTLLILGIGIVIVGGRKKETERTRRVFKTKSGKPIRTWNPPIGIEPSKYGGSQISFTTGHQMMKSGEIGWQQQHFPLSVADSCASSNVPLMLSHAPSMASICSNQHQQLPPKTETATTANLYGSHLTNMGANAAMAYAQTALMLQQQHYQQQYYPHYQNVPMQMLQGAGYTNSANNNQYSLPFAHANSSNSIGSKLGNIQFQQQQPSSLQVPPMWTGTTTMQQPTTSSSQADLNAMALTAAANTSIISGNLHHSSSHYHQHLHHHSSQHHNNTTNTTNTNTSTCSRSSSSGIGGSSTEHSPIGIHSGIQESDEDRAKNALLEQLRLMARTLPTGLIGCKEEIARHLDDRELEPWMVNTVDEREQTLLHLLFLNVQMTEQQLLCNIDILFKAGVFVDAQNNDGTTALSLAVRHRKPLAIRKLIEDCSADSNVADQANRTPFYHLCAILRKTDVDVQIAEFLLNKVDELEVDTLREKRESPLQRLAILCSTDPLSYRVAELLLKRADATQRLELLNQTGGEQMRTALHMAAWVGHSEMCRLLIGFGANKETQDLEGKTPLFLAVEQGMRDTVRTLLDLGADRNKQDINDTRITQLPHFDEIVMELTRYTEPPAPQHPFHQQIFPVGDNRLMHLYQTQTRHEENTPNNNNSNGKNKRTRTGATKRSATNNLSATPVEEKKIACVALASATPPESKRAALSLGDGNDTQFAVNTHGTLALIETHGNDGKFVGKTSPQQQMAPTIATQQRKQQQQQQAFQQQRMRIPVAAQQQQPNIQDVNVCTANQAMPIPSAQNDMWKREQVAAAAMLGAMNSSKPEPEHLRPGSSASLTNAVFSQNNNSNNNVYGGYWQNNNLYYQQQQSHFFLPSHQNMFANAHQAILSTTSTSPNNATAASYAQYAQAQPQLQVNSGALCFPTPSQPQQQQQQQPLHNNIAAPQLDDLSEIEVNIPLFPQEMLQTYVGNGLYQNNGLINDTHTAVASSNTNNDLPYTLWTGEQRSSPEN